MKKELLLLLMFGLFYTSVTALTPGILCKPAIGAWISVMEPDSAGFKFATTASFSGTNYSSRSGQNDMSNDGIDKDLILRTEKVGGAKVLRISFNGNEGTDGDFLIMNQKGNVVLQANFELIKFPFYSSVDITSLENGIYNVVLKTNSKSHTATLTVE